MNSKSMGRMAGAGALGTLAMTIPMLIAMKTGVAPMPEPVPRAILKTITGGALAGPPLMVLAMIAHFAYGAFWAAMAEMILREFRILQGLALGLLLWLIMQVVVLPLIGWGAFGLEYTPAIAIATLLLHLIYGGITGYLIQKWK